MAIHSQPVSAYVESEIPEGMTLGAYRVRNVNRVARHALMAEASRILKREPRCWNCGGSGVRCCEFGADRWGRTWQPRSSTSCSCSRWWAPRCPRLLTAGPSRRQS
jgi:hypothetical protein